jgi:hypothetical protein
VFPDGPWRVVPGGPWRVFPDIPVGDAWKGSSTGIGALPLDTPMEAVEEGSRCVEDYGVVGSRAIAML